MNYILSILLTPASQNLVELTVVFLRVALGIIMVCHGWPKLLGGIEHWRNIGGVMSNFGIYFWPAFWGFACACTEFFGGISLMLGFGTRIACIFLIINMVVALKMHLTNRDSFAIYSHALTLIVIFVSFLIMGGGSYSLDYYLIH